MTIEKLITTFSRYFEQEPERWAYAPGRANVIGEHTDYYGGHVLPIAIPYGVRVLAARRPDSTLRINSMQMDMGHCGPLLHERPPGAEKEWFYYPLAVLWALSQEGEELPGLNLLYDGDVPVASGLSSSAAMLVATATALQPLCRVQRDPLQIAILCRKAENEFVGVNCGLMDQAASACCQAGHALLLDCAVPEYTQVPVSLAGTARFLVAHSGSARSLSSSAYNERRAQGEAAFRKIRLFAELPEEINPSGMLPTLCSVPVELLEEARRELSKIEYRRARHAISEEKRVQDAVQALTSGDVVKLGELLCETQDSLRDDYDVSSDELNALTEFLIGLPGVFGSRLTGAGFGGCTISLVADGAAEEVLAALRRDFYAKRFPGQEGELPAFYVLPQDGARAEAL